MLWPLTPIFPRSLLVRGHSFCTMLGSTVVTISATVPEAFWTHFVLFPLVCVLGYVDSRTSPASWYGEVCTIDASVVLWFSRLLRAVPAHFIPSGTRSA